MNFENFSAENNDAWKPEAEVQKSNVERLEQVEKMRIGRDWSGITDKLSRAALALDKIDDEKVNKIKLSDFLTSLRMAIPLCAAESAKATKSIASQIDGYSEFAGTVENLGKNLKQLQQDIVANKFPDMASLRNAYRDQIVNLETSGSQFVEGISEIEFAKAS
jgi:hypothetical protein